MPLISFSEPSHVLLLLTGKKTQTTRPRRKHPLKVDDVLYCYYKPRQKKSCRNCILLICPSWLSSSPACTRHNNYFGKAKITIIAPLRDVVYTELEYWAKQDGFKDRAAAEAWFSGRYGSDWSNIEFEIILFRWV